MSHITHNQTDNIELFMDQLFECESKQDIIYYYSKYIQEFQLTRNDIINNFIGIIDGLNELYYNQGTSPLNDECYDELLDLIYNDFPEIQEHFKNKVGSEHNIHSEGEEVKLPFYMGSMNKLKTQKQIDLWIQKYPHINVNHNIKYMMSAKLDGISALFCNGKLYSRGNGTKGRDISFLIPYLNGGGDMMQISHILRGELIIKKETFNNNYKSKYANARNLVCGILNRNYSEEYSNFYHNIDFVVYDIYDDTLRPSEKFSIMKNLEHSYNGIHCVCFYSHGSKITMENLNNVLTKMKTEYDYEIDGIVITQNNTHDFVNGENPKYSFAYKNNDLCVSMNIGIVDKVIWNVSKDNYYKPKIKLIQPILCDSSKIEYVTGFNAKYIFDNKIHKNSKLKIGLSGNVIPHIFEVLNSEYSGPIEGLYPNNEKYDKQLNIDFAWSKNKVDLICLDKDNVDSIIKKNMIFFKTFDMKCGLQETTLKNIYKSIGLYKLEDILGLREETWVTIDKIGKKKAQGFIECFRKTLDWSSVLENNNISSAQQVNELKFNLLIKYCVGSQCFNRGFAMKKIIAHLSCLHELYLTHGEHKINLLSFWSGGPPIDNKPWILQQINQSKFKGITQDSMNLFLEGFVDFAKFMYGLSNSDKIKQKNIQIIYLKDLLNCFNKTNPIPTNNVSQPNNSDFKSFVFVFSGFRNKELENNLLKKGHFISDTINKNTNVLVVKDKTIMSSKIKKALALGNIQIIDGKDFNLNDFL